MGPCNGSYHLHTSSSNRGKTTASTGVAGRRASDPLTSTRWLLQHAGAVRRRWWHGRPSAGCTAAPRAGALRCNRYVELLAQSRFALVPHTSTRRAHAPAPTPRARVHAHTHTHACPHADVAHTHTHTRARTHALSHSRTFRCRAATTSTHTASSRCSLQVLAACPDNNPGAHPI